MEKVVKIEDELSESEIMTNPPHGFMCKDVVENIMDYIDKELDLETLTELEKHTGMCPECRAFVDTYKRMLDLAGKLKEKKFVTPEIRNRLRILLQSKVKPS